MTTVDGERLDELLIVERVLARAMRDNAAMERLVRGGITDAEFEVIEHRAVVRAMLACFGRTGTADMALVEENLRRVEGWDAPKSREWLNAIARDGGAVPLDDESYTACLDRLRHLAALRRVRSLGDRMRAMADADQSAAEIAADAGKELEAIVLGSANRRIHTGRALAERFVKRIHEPATQAERVPTGIPFIDKALRGGVKRGLVFMIGATLGAGKTTFANHMLLSALSVGPSAYFSLEVPGDLFFDGLVEMVAKQRIDFDMGREAGSALVNAAADPRLEHLYVDDGQGAGMTSEEIAAKLHTLAKRGIKSAFIDYAQIVEWSTRFKSDAYNFGHISKTLRRAGERYNLALFVVVQMGAQQETPRGKRKRQTEEDVADTRQLAKDASYAAILERDKHSEDEATRNTTRISLTKNRPDKDLATGWMRYDPRTTEIHPCDSKGERITTVTMQPEYVDEWDDALNEALRDEQ